MPKSMSSYSRYDLAVRHKVPVLADGSRAGGFSDGYKDIAKDFFSEVVWTSIFLKAGEDIDKLDQITGEGYKPVTPDAVRKAYIAHGEDAPFVKNWSVFCVEGCRKAHPVADKGKVPGMVHAWRGFRGHIRSHHVRLRRLTLYLSSAEDIQFLHD